MTPEHTKQLIEAFPSLYDSDFYVECDDGWFKLIWDLSKKLSILDKKLKATQVKEKFGGLRFYTSSHKRYEIESIIYKAEALSYITCEICGNPGKYTNDGSCIKTLCDKHAEIFCSTH